MRLLDRNPLNELSLRMVAREAGVAAPSLYAHFPDAKTMISEVGRECWRQLGEVMAHSTQALEQPKALNELKSKMAAYVGYAMERPSRYQLLFAPEHAISEASETMTGLVQPAYRSVFASIKHFAAEGGILPGKDEVSATLVVLSLAHGRIALAHLAPWRAANSAEGVTEFVAETIDRLFATAGTVTPAPLRLRPRKIASAPAKARRPAKRGN